MKKILTNPNSASDCHPDTKSRLLSEANGIGNVDIPWAIHSMVCSVWLPLYRDRHSFICLVGPGLHSVLNWLSYRTFIASPLHHKGESSLISNYTHCVLCVTPALTHLFCWEHIQTHFLLLLCRCFLSNWQLLNRKTNIRFSAKNPFFFTHSGTLQNHMQVATFVNAVLIWSLSYHSTRHVLYHPWCVL